MAAIPPCDGCGQERTLFMVSNVETGSSQYFGMLCLTMLALTTMKEADEEGLDEAVKALGYQVAAAEKKRRAAAPVDRFDPDRVLAKIIIPADDEPGDESASGEGDQSADPQVDNSILDVPADEVGSNVEIGEAFHAASEAEPRPDLDDPAPY